MTELTDGLPFVQITERLIHLMVRRYGKIVPLHVILDIIPGPCRDDWCQALQKLTASIVTGKTVPDGTVHTKSSCETDVYVDKTLYDIAYKNRETIVLDAGHLGNIKVMLLKRNFQKPSD
jgi:hypothetical protein